MPTPSPNTVPSALAEKGRQSPLRDNACTLLKHMNMLISFSVSTPPVMTISALPSCNSLNAMDNAANDVAHAASTTQLVPPKLNRLATRPATTLPNNPGKVASCHGTYEPR